MGLQYNTPLCCALELDVLKRNPRQTASSLFQLPKGCESRHSCIVHISAVHLRQTASQSSSALPACLLQLLGLSNDTSFRHAGAVSMFRRRMGVCARMLYQLDADCGGHGRLKFVFSLFGYDPELFLPKHMQIACCRVSQYRSCRLQLVRGLPRLCNTT